MRGLSLIATMAILNIACGAHSNSGSPVPDDRVIHVQGYVTDSRTGEPLEGALISVLSFSWTPSTMVVQTMTLQDGKYEFTVTVPRTLSCTNLHLSMSHSGYASRTAPPGTVRCRGGCEWVDFETVPSNELVRPAPGVGVRRRC